MELRRILLALAIGAVGVWLIVRSMMGFFGS